MNDIGRGSTFDNKVAALLALTSELTVTQVLHLKRMTLADPMASAWATGRELEVVFNAILERALSRLGPEELARAADDQFRALLPPGPEKEQVKERRLLFDLAQKHLPRRKPRHASAKPPPPAAPG